MPHPEDPPRRGHRTPGGLRHRVRYRLDNLLARGTWAVLVWLGIVTVLALLVSTLLLFVFRVAFSGSQSDSALEDFWQSLLRVLDTGTMAADVGWGRRLLALTVTVFGVLVAGTLIGVIAAGVEQRIDQMRRGRSVVIERDHVVVLGTSDRLPVLVEQLVLAEGSRRRSAIVVLADADPAEMHEEVHRTVADHGGTRIVFRSGDPTRATDLALANLDEARTVIVLNGVGGDAAAVKTVLAVGAELGGFGRKPIVVELEDPAVGERLVRAAGDGVHPIVAPQATARAAAFSLREHGLSQVIGELFDFRGADVYVHRRDDLVGLPFGDIVNRFANGRPIGRMRADGSVELAPPPATRFVVGDRLVVITDDPDALVDAEPRPARPAASSSPGPPLAAEPEVDHLLLVGWSDLGRLILADWGALAPPASTATIVYDPALVTSDEIATPDLDTDRVSLVPLDGTTDVVAQARRMPVGTTVVFLGYRRLSVDGADNRTLLDVMALRNDVAEGGGSVPRVVVELLDVDNVPLARLSGADDFLVSQAIGSQFIAQLAEQPERRPVFLELYAPDGPSIHLVPAERLRLAGELSAGDVYDVAHAAGVVALGWRRATERGGDLTLNPLVTRRVRFEPGDEIVVIG